MKPWRSTFVTNAIIFGSGLLGGMLAARFLGADDRGLLAAIIYWPHFIAGIAAMGLNEGIVIRTAGSGSTDTIRATAIAVSIALAIPLGILGYVIVPLLLGDTRHDYAQFTQIYFIAFLPVTFLAQNLLAIDQGEFEFQKFNVQRVLQAIIYPLLLIGLWCVGLLTVESAAVAVLAGTTIVAINRIWHARSGLLTRPSFQEGWQLLVQSFRLHIVNIVVTISLQVDKMVLVLLSTNTQLGLYTVAITASAAGPSLFVQTYINIMLPSAAKVGVNPKAIYLIISPLKKLIAIITITTAALVMLMPYLMPLIFGSDYADAGLYAQILTVTFFFISIKKVLMYLMRSWNSNKSAVLGEFLTAFILVVGAYYFVTRWSTVGLCILMLIAHSAGALLIGYFFFKKIQLLFKQITSNAEPIGKC